MESIGDLFKNRPVQVPQKRRTPRGDLIDFFASQGFTHKDGSKFTKKQLAVRLAHLADKDLYYIKSVYQDEKNRGHNAAWYFMGATKTKRT